MGWNRAEHSGNACADGGSMNEELARCDREIAEAFQQTEAPAWLVTLGSNDWMVERSLILKASQARSGAPIAVVPVETPR